MVNINIKRLLSLICVFAIFSSCICVCGAGINEKRTAFGSEQNVAVSSDKTINFTVSLNARYRLKLTAETSDSAGIMIKIRKNDKVVRLQYIPKSDFGIVDVRMLAAAGDVIAFDMIPDAGREPVISYEYEITSYDGSLPINETSGGQGDKFTVIESTKLLDYINNAKTNGTKLYAVYNNKKFDMSYSSNQNYWQVNVLRGILNNENGSYVFFRLNGATADLGSQGGSPNVDIPITKDGLIHISGKIPGITVWQTENDATYDDDGNEIPGYYSQNYAGVCSSLFLNGDKLWSSRVGKSSVRYDEEYDSSYFREDIDVVARVKKGDVLRFSFEPWRRYFLGTRSNVFKADISDVSIDYVEGNAISDATEKLLDSSIVFDLYSKQLLQNGTAADADIIFKDGEIYLAVGEASEIFGNISGIEKFVHGRTIYQNLAQTIAATGASAEKIDDRLLIVYDGISGQYSYAELSRIKAAFCGDSIMTEDGSPIELSNPPDKVRLYARTTSTIAADNEAKILLAGYLGGRLVWLRWMPYSLKSGDSVVSKVMELDNTVEYDKLSFYVWTDELIPLASNNTIEK